MQLELWPDKPQVTAADLRAWIEQRGWDPDSWRAHYYVKHWHVAEKIAEAKRQELRRLSRRNVLEKAHRAPPPHGHGPR